MKNWFACVAFLVVALAAWVGMTSPVLLDLTVPKEAEKTLEKTAGEALNLGDIWSNCGKLSVVTSVECSVH